MRRAHLALVATLVIAGAGWMGRIDPPTFPHDKHERVFPTCFGCHAGIPGDDSAASFPSPEQCARCHDGAQLPRVAWTAPTEEPTNLRYSHARHIAKLAEQGKEATCYDCHRSQGDTARMAVHEARPSTCLTCHVAPSHLDSAAQCTTCHVRLADARTLTDSQVSHFPRPRDHAAGDFIGTHGAAARAKTARCATCHAQESCARCHPNVASIDVVSALGSDARVARLVASLPAKYPPPPSHRASGWDTDHGRAAAAGTATCANCHTRSGCESCHRNATRGAASTAIASLPSPAAGMASGVRLQARSVHPAGWQNTHGPAAASGRTTCMGCHQETTCAECHDGFGRRRFHALNYQARHAADAYGQQRRCSSCHNPESFCRSCHVGNGIASSGRAAAAGTYHDAQPNWLLQHGQAARVGLSGCTSCHQQKDCLRCHAAEGSWRVSPHGPGFDPRSMSARNKQTCRVCHATDPVF